MCGGGRSHSYEVESLARSVAMARCRRTAWPGSFAPTRSALRIGPRSRACSSGMGGTFSGPTTRLPTTTWRSAAASSNWQGGRAQSCCRSAQRQTSKQALLSREVIGLAQGILIERECITPEQAADVLRRVSQHLNEKVHNIAQILPTPAKDPGTGSRRCPTSVHPVPSRSTSSLDHAYGGTQVIGWRRVTPAEESARRCHAPRLPQGSGFPRRPPA